jgi:hypothetical protein
VKDNVAPDRQPERVKALTLDKADIQEEVCHNPFCDNRLKQTGSPRPRLFCSEACKQTEFRIRCTAAVLVPLGQDDAWRVLTEVLKAREGQMQ